MGIHNNGHGACAGFPDSLLRRTATICVLIACALILAASADAAESAVRPVVAPAETAASCRAISAKHQLVLERRALGGDHQAQYVLATCAWLRDVADIALLQRIVPENAADAGQNVLVTLTLANRAAEGEGGAAASDIAVVDGLPRGLRRVTGESDFSAFIERLEPGETETLQYEAVIADPAAFAAWRGEIAAAGSVKRAMGSADLSYRYSRADKILYTYLWSTLAFCDRQFNDLAGATEELEAAHRIYRRRMPANDFKQQLRAQLVAENRELNRIRREANDALYLLEGDPVRESSKAFVEMLDGLGATGLVALGYMRDCPAYPGVQQRHARAAIWRKASQLVSGGFRIGEDSAAPSGDGWLEEIVGDIDVSLSSEDRKSVDRFAEDYGLYDSAERIARLEQGESLALMGRIPVQYLQLALGAFRKTEAFPQGLELEAFTIDNVYGERTSKLVKQAQVNFCVIRDVAISEDALRNVLVTDAAGRAPSSEPPAFDPADDCTRPGSARAGAERDRGPGDDYPTGWLTALQSRALICRAAADRQDPYAYLHLAQMFANGYGYRQDFDRAIFAVRRAQRLFSAGPAAQSSNYGDLFNDDLTTDYREEADVLKESVYRLAAEVILGRTLGGPGADPAVRSRIDARIAGADYDRPGNLCADQVWDSEPVSSQYSAGGAPLAKFASSRLPLRSAETDIGAAETFNVVRVSGEKVRPLSVLTQKTIEAGRPIGGPRKETRQ